MVQFRPFRCKLRHALQHTHLQSAVREGDAEEYAFEFAVCLLVFFRLADAFLQLLALYLLVALVHKSVVFGFEVGGADVLRAVRVLAEMPQEVYGVTPHGAVSNGVAVADTYLHGCPIPLYVKGTADIVAQHGILPCFQQRFGSAVGKDSREKVVRQYVVVFAIEAVAFQFGYETLSGIGADGVYIVCTEFVVLAYLHVAVFRP